MYEKTLEKQICNKVKDLGGRAFKWVCPGVSGVPDRICILPGGRIIFIELKRPRVKNGLSSRQGKIISVLEKLGCRVRRINCKEDFDKTLEELSYGL